jgi:F0F1-type ATP synthase assembly protein I
MDRDDRRSDEREPAAPPGQARGGMSGLGLAGLGVQFAASLVLSYFVGQWLDRRLGTAPVFLFVFVFGGAGASFFAMYRQLMSAQRREEAERKAAGRPGGPGSPPPGPRA